MCCKNTSEAQLFSQGGVAYSKSTVTTNKVEATVGNVDMTIAGKGVKLSGDIYAGGFAHGAKTAASVNSTLSRSPTPRSVLRTLKSTSSPAATPHWAQPLRSRLPK